MSAWSSDTIISETYLKGFQMPEHQHKDIKLLKSQIFNELEFKDWNQMSQNHCGEVNDI